MAPSLIESLLDRYKPKHIEGLKSPDNISSSDLIPSIDELLNGRLSQLADQHHMIDEPTECEINGKHTFIWYITSNPIPDITPGESRWIEEEMGYRWFHRYPNDEGIMFWQFYLTPTQNEIANQIMEDWTEAQIRKRS